MRILDAGRLAPVPMIGIIEHWTAGNKTASALDRQHYHLLTEQPANVIYAVNIALNSGGIKNGYAAHTLNANSGRIGHSLCGMMGAVENPFNPGVAPITKKQWDTHVLAAADMCEFYKVPVARDKVLFHAEVQSTLGIKQRGKWDVTRLPFDASVVGARAVGDRFRDEVLAALKGNAQLPASEPVPAAFSGAKAVVTAKILNLRTGPGTNQAAIGTLPAGTELTVLSANADWLMVRTPAGREGWLHGGYVKMTSTITPAAPTVPDPLHSEIESIVDVLEALDQNLPADRASLTAALSRIRSELTPF